MPFEPIKIAGPPQKTDAALIGFPYEIPLSQEPSQAWAERFESSDWTAATGLNHPYLPKLRGRTIAIPGISDPQGIRRVLDGIKAGIESINEAIAQQTAQKDQEDATSKQAAEQRDAAAQEVFDQWWREQS